MSDSKTEGGVRLVHCRKLGKDLPGLTRAPYRNELGRRVYEEVSKEAWDLWLKESVKFINTYRVDLASPEGQKFMFKQCAIYFGFEEGELAQTAFVPATSDAGATKEEPK
ncbi:MAG: oxidative damage protection protein [Polyangiaceae bacterium]